MITTDWYISVRHETLGHANINVDPIAYRTARKYLKEEAGGFMPVYHLGQTQDYLLLNAFLFTAAFYAQIKLIHKLDDHRIVLIMDKKYPKDKLHLFEGIFQFNLPEDELEPYAALLDNMTNGLTELVTCDNYMEDGKYVSVTTRYEGMQYLNDETEVVDFHLTDEEFNYLNVPNVSEVYDGMVLSFTGKVEDIRISDTEFQNDYIVQMQSARVNTNFKLIDPYDTVQRLAACIGLGDFEEFNYLRKLALERIVIVNKVNDDALRKKKEKERLAAMRKAKARKLKKQRR